MSNPVEAPSKYDRFIRLLPALLFFAALGLRLIGIGWGLPNDRHYASYHPDEPVNLFFARQISVGKGDFDPGFYNYGTLYLTVLSVANDVVAGYAGLPENPSPAQVAAFDAKVHMAGRIVSALAGAGTVLLAFLAMRRWFSPFASALGALMILVAPGHVIHSRFQTVDVLAAFLLSASAYFALLLLSTKDEEPIADKLAWRYALLSGLFAGLSAGTKYNGVLVLVVLVVALAFSKVPKRGLKTAAGIGLAILSFVITTPGIFLNSSKFWQDFMYEVQHVGTGHGLVFEGYGSGFLVQILNMMMGIGPFLFAVALVGLVWGTRRREPAMIALASFSLLFFLLIGRAEIFFLRYTFPLYFGLAFGVGFLIHVTHGVGKLGQIIPAAVIAFLGGLPLGGGLMHAGSWSVRMVTKDPRDAAFEYLQSQAKTDPNITVGVPSDTWFYSPPFYPLANSPRYIPFEVRFDQQLQTSAPKVVQYVPADPSQRFDWDIRLLNELKPDFVAASSFESVDLARLQGMSNLRPEVKVQVDRFTEFQKLLQEQYEPSYLSGGPLIGIHDLDYVRPIIWIWKRKPAP